MIIRLTGRAEKRKKKLSKAVCGTSHIISLAEVKLSDEAADYFKRKDCQVELLHTPKAIEAWNEAKGAVIGLFHVTC